VSPSIAEGIGISFGTGRRKVCPQRPQRAPRPNRMVAAKTAAHQRRLARIARTLATSV
jgi:hypothetical protein